MERGTWQATVRGSTRVGRDLVTKQQANEQIFFHCAVDFRPFFLHASTSEQIPPVKHEQTSHFSHI